MGIVRIVQDPKTGEIIAQEWRSEDGMPYRLVDQTRFKQAPNKTATQERPQSRRARSKRR